MNALSIILNIVLILVSLVLIAAVLMQQGQRQGLGAIAGGADTFFGKNKAMGLDAKLQKITKIAAVLFIVLAIATTMVVSHNNTSTSGLTEEELNALIDSLAITEVAGEDAAEGETTDDATVADDAAATTDDAVVADDAAATADDAVVADDAAATTEGETATTEATTAE